MSQTTAAPSLQFEPLSCRVEVQFWFELERRKLHDYKDSVFPVTVWGAYSTSSHPTISSAVTLSAEAFTSNTVQPFHYPIQGTLINTNTIEELKRYDRKQLLKDVGDQIWNDIRSGAWLSNPGTLNQLILLCYADLKLHKFHHCVAFPVLMPAVPFRRASSSIPITDAFTTSQQETIYELYSALRSGLDPNANPNVFVVAMHNDTHVVQVHPISAWTELHGTGVHQLWLAVADPCAQPTVPGWTARNVLLAATVQFQLEGVIRLLCYREVPGRQDISRSTVVDVEVSAGHILREGADAPDYSGWPADNKLKTVDLSPLLDETKLSSSSATLNLNLMKWRMLPSLDLQKFESTKCLLIGAGTLGCNVARNLMMWGVTHITFLDYGKVCYSNPVRQTLFEFRDAKEGRSKAEAAADACQRIYPACKVSHVCMAVPMPGHPVDPARAEAVKQDVSQLTDLIKEADVVFLLTDSRESRWLPTLLCTLHDKLCLNAALGFASYMVMRHGLRTQSAEHRLGCYYCSTVTAPRDSLSDRTLDQQCTVTRPGISAIASALAVELMAATLQHPSGPTAPADTEGDTAAGLLGLVPHQIRGQVDTFQQDILYGKAYDRCTACSTYVLDAYEKDGFEFIQRALNDPEHLEDVTGLRQVKAEVEQLLAKMEEDTADDLGSDEEWSM